MPSSVYNLLNSFGLPVRGPVKWGNSIPEYSSGIYIVSLSSNPKATNSEFKKAPVSREAINNWLGLVPRMRIDGRQPTVRSLKTRLTKFWLPDETILYVGKTDQPILTRLNQYYSTPLGHGSPHRGGHWIKSLSILDELFVYWTTVNNPEELEQKLLLKFELNVSETTRDQLYDPNCALPFANLKVKDEGRQRLKRHGLSYQAL